MSRPKPVQLAKLLVGVAIAGFFALRAFGKLDWRAAEGALRNASPFWILVALLALATDYAIRVGRWWTMLRAINPRLPLSACFRPFLGSIAMNNVLPFRAGDVARAVGFGKELGVETSEVVGTMVIERLLDLLSIVAVFAVALSGTRAGGVPPSLVSGAVVAAGVGGALLLVLLLAPQKAARLFERIASRRAGTARKVADATVRFLDSLAVLRSPSRAAGLVGMSFAAWIFEGATFAATARALDPGHGASGGWFAMSVGTLSTMIPSTPGAIGVFDYFTSLAFQGYGMDKSPSVLTALVVHVVLWLPLTLVGLGLLALRNRRTTPVGDLTLSGENS